LTEARRCEAKWGARMGEGERKKDGVCAEADTWWRADYNYREMVGFRAEKAVRETQWHDRVP